MGTQINCKEDATLLSFQMQEVRPILILTIVLQAKLQHYQMTENLAVLLMWIDSDTI